MTNAGSGSNGRWLPPPYPTKSPTELLPLHGSTASHFPPHHHLASLSTHASALPLPSRLSLSMSAASTATRLLVPRPAAPFRSLLLPRRRGRLQRAVHASAVAAGGGGGGISGSSGGGAAKEPPRTLFPGGFKRPEIQVPALVLRVGAEEALRSGDEVAAAVARGVGIVVLEAGKEGGGRAYEAAVALRAVVGDRAYLLIAERVDVASAVGASGVVLADDGW